MTQEDTISLFTIVGLIVSGVTAALFAYAYFRSKVGSATIHQQSELIVALTERVDLLSNQRIELTNSVKDQATKIADLEARNLALEKIVTGKRELDEILQIVNMLKEGLIDVKVTPSK